MNKIKALQIEEIAIVMSDNDNAAISKSDIIKGTTVISKGEEIKVIDDIPKGCRFALFNIRKGELVNQYGFPFGISKGIKQGQIINKNNVDIYRSDDYETMVSETFKNKRALSEKAFAGNKAVKKTFMGYVRENGHVGTRNFYLIVPTSLCASDIASKIAFSLDNNKSIKKQYKNIDGIVAAAHTEGCGCNDGEIIDRLLLTIKNTITHPNVGGALIVDLGCEKTNYEVISRYLGNLSSYKKPLNYISIQELGGTGNALSEGKKIVTDRLKEINSIEREKVSIRHLIVGTECGASDSFSGITANPLIGSTVDKIISAGGSAILSETPEMIGAERSLIGRMVSKDVANKFIKGINYYKALANKLNVSMDGNFVAGNEEGGLINLTLKSLGAVLKGGSSNIVDFIDYSELVKHQGLSIMNGPGNDLESVTGITASGANIILFSTGMGATEGGLIAPVIKISTRTELFKKMKEDIDFNAGRLIDENITLDKLSDDLLELTIKVASGQKTWSDIWQKRPFQVWTAGKLSL